MSHEATRHARALTSCGGSDVCDTDNDRDSAPEDEDEDGGGADELLLSSDKASTKALKLDIESDFWLSMTILDNAHADAGTTVEDKEGENVGRLACCASNKARRIFGSTRATVSKSHDDSGYFDKSSVASRQ